MKWNYINCEQANETEWYLKWLPVGKPGVHLEPGPALMNAGKCNALFNLTISFASSHFAISLSRYLK